ncbi:MAG: DUF3179 domain-containing protein, partial [Proteobacteria bacterium]|nr:DUF3179 domain-containing protein [Pseudomonadota bacterium]
WVIGIACFAVLVGRGLMGVADEVWLWTALPSIGMLMFMFWSGYVPYVMTPPVDPKILSIEEADKLIKQDEVVIGLVNGGDVRAYSRDTVARPHFYADTVGGTPVIVSYCILCNSSMAFKTELKGKPMDLSCVTAYNNNIIYRDANSGNFIQQLDSKIIHGPDKGEELEFLPTIMATWGEWKQLHPDTKLYYAPAKTFRDKMVAVMLGMMIPIHKLAARSKPWHRVQGKLDTRLPAMSFVYGVELNGDLCAYSTSFLKENPVYNDTVGGEPIVVFYDKARDIGAIYSRNIDDSVLEFEQAPADGVIAMDKQSGSSWDLTGKATGGNYAGQSLEGVPHYNKIFWFSWALFKDGTRVCMAT